LSLRELKTIMEYIDSKIGKLREELVEDLKRSDADKNILLLREKTIRL